MHLNTKPSSMTPFQILAEWAFAKMELAKVKNDVDKFPNALKRFRAALRQKKKLDKLNEQADSH